MCVRVSLALACLAVAADGLSTARAQQITVQQPVFSNFSVATTVSVPDRGSALLGGVSSAGDFASQRGPLGLAGRSRGSFRNHQNVTAHVYIHDFEAMDRYLLSRPTGAGSATEELLGGRARRAYETLVDRGQIVSRGSTAAVLPGAESVQPSPPGSSSRTASAVGNDRSILSGKGPPERAALYLQKGIDALDRGEVGVAKIHLRMSARHGSTEAAERLATIEAGAAGAMVLNR